jgi:hypothetical protein
MAAASCLVPLAWIAFVVPLAVSAQPAASAPCSAPESKQFDFWLGEWKVRWDNTPGSEPAGTGRNRVERILGGCVIEENFTTDEVQPLIGRSVSMWSPQQRRWLQTWVDNQGSYLDFAGEFKDGRMILAREGFDAKGEKIRQRMVFESIATDRLDWRWESSRDGGEWKLVWLLHYERVK